MARPFRRLVAVLCLILLGGALSGCIFIEDHPYPRWCYWHPYGCH